MSTFDSISIGDVELYYQTAGDGPPIVFLHGFGGNHLSWWQQIPTFAGEYRCISPDQRMFGRSRDEPDGPGAEAFVDDLVELLDHLRIERTTILGHSMGGWTASSFATQYPDRVSGLVLSGSPGGLLPSDEWNDLREEASGSLPDVDPLSPETEFLSDSIRGLNVHAPAGFDDVRPTLEGFQTDSEPILDAEVPVLLVTGEADPIMPPRAASALQERLDGAESAVVEGARHSSNFDNPEEFNRIVRGFVDETVGR